MLYLYKYRSHTCKVDCRSQENYEKNINNYEESINKMNDHILRETCLAACTIKYLLLLTVRNDNHITYKNLLTYFLNDTSYMLLLIYLLMKNRLECIHLEPKTQKIIFKILNFFPFSFEWLDFNSRSFQ
jgi:hypothetical protein